MNDDKHPDTLDDFAGAKTIHTAHEVLPRLTELTTIDGRDLSDDERQEIEELEDIVSEVGGYEAAESNVALIRDDNFIDYAQEFVQDVEGISEGSFIFSHINWEGVATAMQQDYSQLNLRGDTYWFRA